MSENLPSIFINSVGPVLHEIRSPLAVVYGFSKMLEMSPNLSDAEKTYIKHMVDNSERLDKMLEKFSQMGRIASGRIKPNLRNVQMSDIIQNSPLSDKDKVQLENLSEDCEIETDLEWICQAISEIVHECLEAQTGETLSVSFDGKEIRFNLKEQAYAPEIEHAKARQTILLATLLLESMKHVLARDDNSIVIHL